MPTPGLTAGRVNGEKNTPPVAPARTAPLTGLRRWPGDGFFGQKSEVGIPTSVEESRPRCGAGLAGGFYARQWRGRVACQAARL